MPFRRLECFLPFESKQQMPWSSARTCSHPCLVRGCSHQGCDDTTSQDYVILPFTCQAGQQDAEDQSSRAGSRRASASWDAWGSSCCVMPQLRVGISCRAAAARSCSMHAMPRRSVGVSKAIGPFTSSSVWESHFGFEVRELSRS